MINREIGLPERKSYFLFGPRQTGKSTLVKSRLRADAWEVNLLHTDQFRKYLKAPELLRREVSLKVEKEGVRTVFIDEIQRVPPLLDEIHALIETHPSCQFILTGSSARKLKRGGANLLAGRALQRFLHPLTLAEMAGDFILDEVLRFGSLPSVHLKPESEKIEMLKAYCETYLREEIQAEGLVRSLGGFSRFLDVAAAQCGELVNFSDVGRQAQIPTKTVQSYYDILEDTLVGLRLEGYHRSVRRRLTRHPKFYLFDLGVTNSINRRLGEPPDPMTRGRLFEQWVVLETHRQLSYRQSEARLFYWRTNTGAEVDLLIERAGKILAACEIKTSRHLTGADLTGLRSFHRDHPETPLYVVGAGDQRYRLEGVEVLPWSHYIKTLVPRLA